MSGLLTGYAGMPGPPVVPYYAGRDLPRATIKASMQLIFTNTSKVLVDSRSGSNLMYLPIDKLIQQAGSAPRSPDPTRNTAKPEPNPGAAPPPPAETARNTNLRSRERDRR